MAKKNGSGPEADWRAVRDRLRKADFAGLFVEELGWDPLPRSLPLEVTVRAGSEEEATYELSPIAEKRGFVAYRCPPTPDGGIPSRSARDAIDRRAAKDAYEHFVVYTDSEEAEQVWQWARREPGRPAARREHRLSQGAGGEPLARRIAGLAVSLKEEEDLTIVEVSGRVRAAFDVEPVTKKFYDGFQKQHAAFLGFIEGIEEQGDREWYASIMLNRLMFVYFIEKKGFLDGGDTRYLRNRMEALQASARGSGSRFLTFYRHFLMRLFHEGLSRERALRDEELDELLGDVPYLNGGLFEPHELEREHPDISIPDEAFERLFDFFDGYTWHLDERPLRAGNEINPDVLGYIFEKYVNQKQMGAYYTKEDVTGYITQNTLVPRLFDVAEEECAIAFEPGGAMWNLLVENPDRYVYDAVKKGVVEDGGTVPLPEKIQAGVDDVSERGGWNRPADDGYALPTETWREHVARRERCEDLREKLAAGEVTAIGDLVTLNLDVRQFAQDAIENCEGPELLRAFYKGIQNVSVLDPTCGSGAFLFAALNVLEPMYEACLERMERFRDEDPSGKGYADFREILGDADRHPNRRYFVLKSIAVRNLYGVDIMEEAVEIARLRLFLKLMAQLESRDQIEPLPDIDFNLRSGNTLVGFASLQEVRDALRSRFDFGVSESDIERRVAETDRTFEAFRRMQVEDGWDSQASRAAKGALRDKLRDLGGQLDRFLAYSNYGVKAQDDAALAQWRASHRPFHWFVEFHGILDSGGFDVVIGNPPYLRVSDIKDTYTVVGYETLPCGDLYSLVMERSAKLSKDGTYLGMIVPVSVVSADGFSELRRFLGARRDVAWSASFAERPSKLFVGAEKRLTIWLTRLVESVGEQGPMHLSSYARWSAEEREVLFEGLRYVLEDGAVRLVGDAIPKTDDPLGVRVLQRLSTSKPLGTYLVPSSSRHLISYTRKLRYFVQFFDFVPRITAADGRTLAPTELKGLMFHTGAQRDAALALLNSNLFFWFFSVYSDVRNVNKREIEAFRCTLDDLSEGHLSALARLSRLLMESFRENAVLLVNKHKTHGTIEIESFRPRLSKGIIDRIDNVLADHYGLTDEELDFIVNHDIKYRMGAEPTQ